MADDDVSAAWEEYLEHTRSCKKPAYDRVESWAWARLQSRLKTIKRQRKRAARKAVA